MQSSYFSGDAESVGNPAGACGTMVVKTCLELVVIVFLACDANKLFGGVDKAVGNATIDAFGGDCAATTI